MGQKMVLARVRYLPGFLKHSLETEKENGLFGTILVSKI
jgi:hypothetical protein